MSARREAPDRNLALELVRVTEAGAMAAGRWVGRGDKEGGDGAAVDAMRELVNSVSMRGVVVIGEGEKDNAPMLYNGEEVGNGDGPECDFAVDPVDGTTLMAKGMPNAISVLAVAERGAMFDPSAVFYMNKIAVGPDAVDVIDISAPIGENIRRVAKAKNLTVPDLTVCVLDRPRHAQLMEDVREAGARIRLISDGDVAGAIAACRPGSGTDLLAGIGGTPEGIITAASISPRRRASSRSSFRFSAFAFFSSSYEETLGARAGLPDWAELAGFAAGFAAGLPPPLPCTTPASGSMPAASRSTRSA